MSLIQKALDTELQRQHDHSGISGLVISQTEEPSVLQVHGPVDLKALALAVAEALGIDKPVFPAGKEQVYLYDCGRGQGSVKARSLEEAKANARHDSGASDPATNVHLATQAELDFRKTMGGDSNGF